MSRTASFGEERTGILDRLIFWLRKRQFSHLFSSPLGLAVDLGCGYRAELLRLLRGRGLIARGHAVDLSLDREIFYDGISGEEQDLNSGVVSLPDGSADLVISLAVLEHLNNPTHHIAEAFRLLGSRKRFLLTTPSPLGKPVLEFLAYRLHMIDEAEIRDHKHYFSVAELEALLKNTGFRDVRVRRFLCGLNTIAEGVKP